MVGYSVRSPLSRVLTSHDWFLFFDSLIAKRHHFGFILLDFFCINEAKREFQRSLGVIDRIQPKFDENYHHEINTIMEETDEDSRAPFLSDRQSLIAPTKSGSISLSGSPSFRGHGSSNSMSISDSCELPMPMELGNDDFVFTLDNIQLLKDEIQGDLKSVEHVNRSRDHLNSSNAQRNRAKKLAQLKKTGIGSKRTPFTQRSPSIARYDSAGFSATVGARGGYPHHYN